MFGTSDFHVHTDNGFEYLKLEDGKKNSPNLVFLHGMFGGLSNYDPLLKQLTDYNVFVPSIPIYEFKYRHLKIKKLTEWLNGFFEAQELNNTVLLGNSMGGHVALDYALKHPERVSALVLTGSSGLQEMDFGSTFPRRGDREYIKQQAGKTFYEDLIDDVILDEIMDVINDRAKLMSLLAITRDTHKYNMEKFLPEITQDVLLIWGKEDEITPPEAAKLFEEKLPNARLQWIEKCGHAPMMEHPKKFAFFLKEFLLELENKRKSNADHEKNYSHL